MRLIALPLGFAALAVAVTAPARLHAETHTFAPATYYDTMSASHPAALRIKTGDHVATKTTTGAKDAARPETGPFYIEDAQPGDLIVVTIEKLQPTSTTAQASSNMLAATYDAEGLSNKDAATVPWSIDKTKKTVTFDFDAGLPGTDWAERFDPPTVSLPLEPALGALGVAPAAADKSGVAGPFGGDMAYGGLVAGARVFLPVFQPGALLYLGHGLAHEGAGNVTGVGIETPMDVEFSVELVKKKEWPHSSLVRPSTVAGEFEIEWPHVETADYVMASGSAATLGDALKHATTELDHWLDDDFGLSERSVSVLLGPAIEYEIADAGGPTFSVVAKIRKAYLPKARATN